MLGFVACAFVLTSCSQNDILENTNEANAISFSNLNDRVTKAANDNTDDYAVYAIRSNATDVWFMNNIKVSGADDTYSPLQYWPTGGATVNFYAFAPYPGGAVVSSAIADSLAFTYTVPTNADEDFTIATPVRGATSGGASTPVALSFNHMLTKITIEADLKQELKDAGYSITFASATLGVPYKKGTGKLTTTPIVDLTAEKDTATYTGAKTYMFIPQISTGTTLQLNNVVINHNGVEYWSGDLKAYRVVTGNIAADKFKRNTHYTIVFTIDQNADSPTDGPVFGEAIEFSSSVAANWDSANVPVEQP